MRTSVLAGTAFGAAILAVGAWAVARAFAPGDPVPRAPHVARLATPTAEPQSSRLPPPLVPHPDPPRDATPRGAVPTVILPAEEPVIRGVFVTADGTPAAGERIVVTSQSAPPWARAVTSGPDGRFEIDGLSAGGRYTLQGSVGQGLVTRFALLHDVTPGPADVRLAVPRGLHARFRYLRAQDRTPVGSTSTNMTTPGSTTTASGHTWSVVRFDGPGIYPVTFRFEGFEPVSLDPVVVRADADTEVDILLREKAAPQSGD